MKTQIANTKEKQNTAPPKVEQEASTGGSAALEDNRPATVFQRKLQDGMHASSSQKEFPIQRKANNTGLPGNLKSGIENLSGFAMDDVKVHYNSSKPAQLQAHAYAQGSDIHLASGQEKHLPHEAWHVVQQKQGRVQPTRQLKSKVNINDDAGLEREADIMGAKALDSGGTVQRKGGQKATLLGTGVVQRVEGNGKVKEISEEETRKAFFDLDLLDPEMKALIEEVGAVSLDALLGEIETLKGEIENEEDIDTQVGKIEDVLRQYGPLFDQLHDFNEKRGNLKSKERELLEKIGEKPETPHEMEAISEKYRTSSDAKIELGRLRVAVLREREIHQTHDAALPDAKIFIPASGPTNKATFIAHGDQTAIKDTEEGTFVPPQNVAMKYAAPHGYNATASLFLAWESNAAKQRGNFYDFSPGPTRGRIRELKWYNYVLTAEASQLEDSLEPDLQRIADANQVTVLAISSATQTSKLIPELVALGYNDIYPVHCRATQGSDTGDWTPADYDVLSYPSKAKQYMGDTYANINPILNLKSPGSNWWIPLAGFYDHDSLFDPEMAMGFDEEDPESVVQVGTIVLDGKKDCYYRISAITNGTVYLRGLAYSEGTIMANEGQGSARGRALISSQVKNDNRQQYIPGKLLGYKEYK